MKRIRALITVILALVLLLSCGVEIAAAEKELEVRVKAEFRYDDARKMLKLLNQFRTGDNAWYWNENNKSKTWVSGLEGMVYDENLERVAMLRAVETAAYFSHTRPNGSGWSTAFPAGYKTKGENLVYGYGSVETAFKALLEEDQKYAGQGHRRNMLRKEFKRVGFGAVKVGNVMYWAQAFGGSSGGSGKSGENAESDIITALDTLLVKNAKGLSADVEELVVAVGESDSLPTLMIYSNTGAKLYVSGSSWKTLDKKIASITEQEINGVKIGKTSLETVIGGKRVRVPVIVTEKADESIILVDIDDYDPPLAGEFMMLLEEDECFEISDDE